MKHDFEAILRDRKRKERKRSFLRELLDGLAELSLYIIAAIIGLCVFAIFGVKDTDEDAAVIIGMLIIAILMAIPFLIHIKRRKNKRQTVQEASLIAQFPHFFPSILSNGGLFSTLEPMIEDISGSGNEVRIEYGEDTFETTECKGLFTAKLNEVTEKKLSVEQVIHLALEFAHERRRDIKAIVISDAEINSITSEFLTYTDTLGRIHKISLTDAALDYGEPYTVGTTNPRELNCIFYTGAVKTVLSFDTVIEYTNKKYYSKKKNRELYDAFIKDLNRHGYALRDVLTVDEGKRGSL